jgi:hypothetical protein
VSLPIRSVSPADEFSSKTRFPGEERSPDRGTGFRVSSPVCPAVGRHVPLNHLGWGQELFKVCNSSLSEAAILGFEYGFSLDNENALVIWEAQVRSGSAKWHPLDMQGSVTSPTWSQTYCACALSAFLMRNGAARLYLSQRPSVIAAFKMMPSLLCESFSSPASAVLHGSVSTHPLHSVWHSLATLRTMPSCTSTLSSQAARRSGPPPPASCCCSPTASTARYTRHVTLQAIGRGRFGRDAMKPV